MQVFTYYRVFSCGREVKRGFGKRSDGTKRKRSICSVVCDCDYVKYMIKLVWGCIVEHLIVCI